MKTQVVVLSGAFSALVITSVLGFFSSGEGDGQPIENGALAPPPSTKAVPPMAEKTLFAQTPMEIVDSAARGAVPPEDGKEPAQQPTPFELYISPVQLLSYDDLSAGELEYSDENGVFSRCHDGGLVQLLIREGQESIPVTGAAYETAVFCLELFVARERLLAEYTLSGNLIPNGPVSTREEALAAKEEHELPGHVLPAFEYWVVSDIGGFHELQAMVDSKVELRQAFLDLQVGNASTSLSMSRVRTAE